MLTFCIVLLAFVVAAVIGVSVAGVIMQWCDEAEEE